MIECRNSSLKCQRSVYLSGLEQQQNCQVQISALVKDRILVHF